MTANHRIKHTTRRGHKFKNRPNDNDDLEFSFTISRRTFARQTNMKIITATAVSILALAEAGDVRRVTSQADVDVDPVVGRTQPIAIGDQPNASKRWSFFSSWNQLFNSKDQPFVPAITLEEFMSVDPRAFEWVDATEIVAGGTTCGFLHAPLGSLPDIDYPIVDVCKLLLACFWYFDDV